MPATTETLSSQNPFERARLALIKRLLWMPAPSAYPTFPSPDDHMGVKDHILLAAELFDDYLAAIGAEVRDNANCAIDKDLFSGTVMRAIDGNETFALEEAALAVRGMRRAG
jgi:hypothetical protein